MSASLPPPPAPSNPAPCALCLALRAYAYNLARWLDQGLNVLTGGDSRQTVFSRLGRAQLGGKWWADWLLEFKQSSQHQLAPISAAPGDHCNTARNARSEHRLLPVIATPSTKVLRRPLEFTQNTRTGSPF